jgi:hypothetical protein
MNAEPSLITTTQRVLQRTGARQGAPETTHRLVANAHKYTLWYTIAMTRNQVKEILDRVLSWPLDDQEKIARFVREMEQSRADEEIGEEEWEIIEAPRSSIR